MEFVLTVIGKEREGTQLNSVLTVIGREREGTQLDFDLRE